MRERAAIEVESTMGMNMVRVPSHYSASGKPQVMHRSDAIKRFGSEAKHWDAMPESEAASMEAVVLEDGNDRRDPFMRVPRR
jgi:hypothetical protein